MKSKFSIAIYDAHNQETLLLLVQDGRTGEKISLGGQLYSLNYLGKDTSEASKKQILEALHQMFIDNTPVTKEALKQCLAPFGIIAVTSHAEKRQRGLQRTAIMGKGMQAMGRREAPDEARGRTMVENPHINLFMEVRTKNEDVLFAKQREAVFRCWQSDPKTHLALPEWEAYQVAQWQKSKTALDFSPWLYRKTWEQSGTKDDMLTWLIRFEYQKFNPTMPFDAWKKAFISDITTYYAKYCDAGASNDEILNAWSEKAISGLNLSDADYVTFKAWRAAGQQGSFQEAMLRKGWEKTGKYLPFDDYVALQQQALMTRWEESGLKQAGVSFTDWRAMQDPTLVHDTGLRPFIRCDENTRKLYHVTSSETGELLRNGRPYSASYDTTLHSGKGYAIFVVDADEKIYAGSHIQQVFHHSSFLSNAATLASGEVRMGLESVIQYASNQQQVERMLAELKSHHQDPYKIYFIKNEENNTWTIAGENAKGQMKIIPVPVGSALETALKDPAMQDLSFSKRVHILNQAAALLGRTNPTHQVTLLSSKSGHYQPRDEENYYMLKRWERHGVDLSKTPFVSLSSSETYRSAQTYLDLIAPRMRARQATRLNIAAGVVTNHLDAPLASMQQSIVINQKGECYAGDLSHPAFSQQDVRARIDKLKGKLLKTTERIEALDKRIQKSSKSMRAKKSGRQLQKAQAVARLEKIQQEIIALENAVTSTREPPGQQRIHGGGVMTLDAAGEVISLDAKLGDYVLSPQEIKKTLLTLKSGGVNLETLALMTYDAKGHARQPQNAHQYLVEAAQAKRLESLIKSHDVVGASVAVLDNENITPFSAGKLVQGGTEDLTPDAVFEAASLSKPVFAYIVLKMAQRREIDLDVPLCQLSKSGFGPTKLRETAGYQQLTARMVLSHQTGLPNWAPYAFEAEPGSEFNYSGLGFNFLCEVIQASSGLSLEALAKRALEPLGIVQSTYFYQPEDDADEKMRFAVGHDAVGVPDANSHYVKQSEENTKMLFEQPIPGASLFMTAPHYAKFLAACLQDEFIRENMFVSVNDLGHGRDLKGVKAGVPPELLEQLHWGLGMGVQDNSDGSKTLFHWGDSETFRNLVVSRVEKDGTYQGVVCLTNSANGAAIFRQVAEPIVGSIEPIAVWLRKREKLNLSQDAFSATAEVPTVQQTQSMKAQLQDMKKSDRDPASDIGHTPQIK